MSKKIVTRLCNTLQTLSSDQVNDQRQLVSYASSSSTYHLWGIIIQFVSSSVQICAEYQGLNKLSVFLSSLQQTAFKQPQSQGANIQLAQRNFCCFSCPAQDVNFIQNKSRNSNMCNKTFSRESYATVLGYSTPLYYYRKHSTLCTAMCTETIHVISAHGRAIMLAFL